MDSCKRCEDSYEKCVCDIVEVSNGKRVNGAFMEHSDVILNNVHSIKACQKPEPRPCTIHNRSDHPMRDFPQEWSPGDKKMMRVCPDMVGHDDPDELVYAGCESYNCDGCCSGDVFR